MGVSERGCLDAGVGVGGVAINEGGGVDDGAGEGEEV